MTAFKITMNYSDGEFEDEVFETEAEEYGDYLCSCYTSGGEILHMSNPGDYPLEEDSEVDFEVIGVED